MLYVEQPLFAGGCFWAANLPGFDSRPGPVRDLLAERQRSSRQVLATELHHGVAAGGLAALDPDLTAFQPDAVLTSVDEVRRSVDLLLGPGW